MKYKIHILSLLLLSTISFYTLAQGSATARFQATLTQSSANSVIISIKPNETFMGKFSNVQFTIQIPSSVVPAPTLSIKSNPLSAFIPTAGYTTGQTTESGFTTYFFNAVPSGAATYSFVNGTAIDALEISFGGSTGASSVRLAHLPSGGTTGNAALYVEVAGNDNTNYILSFFGPGATNGGDYAAYSYIQLGSIVLPTKFNTFDVVKKDNNGIVNWTVENEDIYTTSYDVERSLNGKDFEIIGTVQKSNLGNYYTFTDLNLTSIKNVGNIIYYRIKQVNSNARVEYTVIKNIRLATKGNEITAFPNPIKESTTIQLDLINAEVITMTLITADGKTIQTFSVQGNKGINTKKIDMADLSPGNYMLKVITETETKSIKLVKL
jgi:hypothetical protein